MLRRVGRSESKSKSRDNPRICLITAFILRLTFESLPSSMNSAQSHQSMQIFIEQFSVLSIVLYASGDTEEARIHS